MGVGQPATLGTQAAGKGLDLNIKVLKMTEDCNSALSLQHGGGGGWGGEGVGVYLVLNFSTL